MFNIASAPFAHNRKQTQTLMLLVILLSSLPILLPLCLFYARQEQAASRSAN